MQHGNIKSLPNSIKRHTSENQGSLTVQETRRKKHNVFSTKKSNRNIKIMYTLQKGIESGSISRKTACRCAIKNGAKNEYIALLLNLSIGTVNRLIEIDDSFIDEFDGTEISTL